MSFVSVVKLFLVAALLRYRGWVMTVKTFDIHEAETHLQEIISLVERGTEVILTEGNVPRARLLPLEEAAPTARIPGLHTGGIWTSEDFDAALSAEFWVGNP